MGNGELDRQTSNGGHLKGGLYTTMDFLTEGFWK